MHTLQFNIYLCIHTWQCKDPVSPLHYFTPFDFFRQLHNVWLTVVAAVVCDNSSCRPAQPSAVSLTLMQEAQMTLCVLWQKAIASCLRCLCRLCLAAAAFSIRLWLWQRAYRLQMSPSWGTGPSMEDIIDRMNPEFFYVLIPCSVSFSLRTS